MLNKIKNNILLILILALGLFLAVKNYTPGTFLSGWDTLHPEFDFGLAFERELSGVFRPEQGLGAVAGHSHMADLPRVLVLYLLHFIFPTDTLRYLYVFLNLIVGPIGMYFFLNKYIVKNKIASFLAALFYLLNLGTMQLFVVPFEMFTTQYALLPWLFLFATDYLHSKQNLKTKLIPFSIVTLLATPMAYAATLWYVYFLIFISYVLLFSFLDRSFSIFKKSVALILLTLAINSFWILPNIYFVLNHGQEVSNALINKLFSPQAFLYNKEFGNIKDITLLKNFLFDWNVYAGNGNFAPLLSPWINHLNQLPVKLIGFIFAIMAFTGILFAFFKKNEILVSFLPALFLCLFFLINDNFPTSFLYNFLGGKIPLFKEAFRFPDDKVLGIFIFVFTVYFAQTQKIILKILGKVSTIFYLGLISGLIFYYALPAFGGNFISPYMRTAIPKAYFEMFDWFKSQDETARVANLPIHSVYGWTYYNWPARNAGASVAGGGFQGADFLQFGIRQPVLNRDFDRWNPANEQYYREMSQAIYSQNPAGLANVLKKYDISFILLDKNVIAPEQGTKPQILFFNEIEKLLTNSIGIQKVFSSGNLSVYKINNSNQKIRIINNPVSVSSPSISYDDPTFAKYHDYVTYSDPKENTVFYPFGNIIDNKNRILSDFVIQSSSPTERQYAVFPSTDPINDCPLSPTQDAKSKMQILEEKAGKFLRYSSDSGSLCNHYSFSDIPRDRGYLISITSRNISGLPLKLCVANYISRRCDLFTQLSPFPTFTKEAFLLPPTTGVGLNINLNSFAIKGSPAVNDLQSIEITPFSYAETLQAEQYSSQANPKEASFIVYSQSFDPGWRAYQIEKGEMKNEKYLSTLISQLSTLFPFLFGKELKEHVLVNNWANGWLLNSQFSTLNSQLVIIFWPQYLEYLGFGILIGAFVWTLWPMKRKPKQ